MATVKHISSKNADYGAVADYLEYQHDEKRNRPVLDNHGNPLLRESYLIDGINCTPATFEFDCVRLNHEYGKNLRPGDVKTHHYIVSFDPSDAASGKLTLDKAQSIGMELARKFFPGHQILVATHDDGSNRSGNMHCHIILNSLRMLDVEKQDFMERDIDAKAGYKFHQTDRFLRLFKAGVMEICEREGLSQVDLDSPAREKITEEEYRAKFRGQERLDKRNAEIIAAGLNPVNQTFSTDLEQLRKNIYAALMNSNNETEFRRILLSKYQIEITESRGRWGYRRLGAQKPIRARRLGTNYEKETILRKLESVKELQPIQAPGHISKQAELEYIQRQAATIRYLQKNGFPSVHSLHEQILSLTNSMEENRRRHSAVQQELRQINRLIHYKGQWLATRNIYLSYLRSTDKDTYRNKYAADIAKYETADKFLHEEHEKTSSPIPALTELRKQKNLLQANELSINDEYLDDSSQLEKLQSIAANIRKMLHVENYTKSSSVEL